jgi:hypothetical protein
MSSPAQSSPATPSSSPATVRGDVSFPNQLLGLHENSSATAGQAISMINRGFVSPLTKGLGGTSKAAIYGDEQNGFFVVVAVKTRKKITSPDDVVNKLQNDWVNRGATDVMAFPAGRKGESVVCEQTQQNLVCLWADHLSIGVVLYSLGSPISFKDGVSKTIQIRSAVMH